MKFQHLPIGARFVYQGETYTKTSPLVASVDGGNQRMIPRYASLSPIEGAAADAPVVTPELVELARVHRALDWLALTLAQSNVDAVVVQQALAQCREMIIHD